MERTERFAVDAYVVDALLPDLVGHDRRPSAFLVYLYLWRKSGGAARATAASLAMIAGGTGLSKRAVQQAVAVLERRQLVSIVRKSATATPIFTLRCHWRAR
jgi:hypothetical protein